MRADRWYDRDAGTDQHAVVVSHPNGTTFKLRPPFSAKRVFSFIPLIVIPGAIITGILTFLILWLAFDTVSRGRHDVFPPSWDFTRMVLLAILVGWAFLLELGFLKFHIVDTLNGQGHLVIREDSLWDEKAMKSPVPWREFRRAQITSGWGTTSVRLWLRRPLPSRRKTLLGMMMAPLVYARGGPTILIDLRFLDEAEDVVAFAIATMVKRNGGKADYQGVEL